MARRRSCFSVALLALAGTLLAAVGLLVFTSSDSHALWPRQAAQQAQEQQQQQAARRAVAPLHEETTTSAAATTTTTTTPGVNREDVQAIRREMAEIRSKLGAERERERGSEGIGRLGRRLRGLGD